MTVSRPIFAALAKPTLPAATADALDRLHPRRFTLKRRGRSRGIGALRRSLAVGQWRVGDPLNARRALSILFRSRLWLVRIVGHDRHAQVLLLPCANNRQPHLRRKRFLPR